MEESAEILKIQHREEDFIIKLEVQSFREDTKFTIDCWHGKNDITLSKEELAKLKEFLNKKI